MLSTTFYQKTKRSRQQIIFTVASKQNDKQTRNWFTKGEEKYLSLVAAMLSKFDPLFLVRKQPEFRKHLFKRLRKTHSSTFDIFIVLDVILLSVLIKLNWKIGLNISYLVYRIPLYNQYLWYQYFLKAIFRNRKKT